MRRSSGRALLWSACLALFDACSSDAGKPTDAGTLSDVAAPPTDGGACDPGGDAAAAITTPVGYFPPTRWMLGPIYGTGCPAFGACETRADNMTAEVTFHLDQFEKYDIPITMYHFDGSAWSPNGTCTWALGDALKDRLAATGIRALMHFWGGCEEEDDFDRIHAQLGGTLAGFYFDEFSSDAMAKAAIDWAQRKMPGDAEVVMKAYQGSGGMTAAGLTAYGHSCYVNDLGSDFDGLEEGIRRVFSMANTLPAPFNEFTAYDGYARPDRETYFRRIHFGAMQVVMDHSPWMDASPWRDGYGDDVVNDFRNFSWLHRELVPYLYSYDWNAYETGAPIFRGANSKAFTTKIGEEIFVAYVTRPMVPAMPFTIALPPANGSTTGIRAKSCRER